jgi:integral membrane protein
MNFSTHLGRLRIAALIEGITCIILYLIAMPLKYMAGIETAVKIPGMVHGIFFIAYLLALLPVYRLQKWSFKTLFIAGIASVVPFMTFWIDVKYLKEPTLNNDDILDDNQ